ncbi:LexA family protein [Candidatus Odyssella acanthamoebae]|uniref:Peptidase S24 n=1 Tax=Candidatus Odyssella acanthamoebae TaxID=91604 RepID=A0A077AVC3_9PROT|nr:translesion error-prone DNA polymerase V autoproteolytic subunit [Candidatus Paracaedibacter acanthamoebae]AIK95984.1 peptidase S24 [Candidatus Paracaedibacter acanthamoebae]
MNKPLKDTVDIIGRYEEPGGVLPLPLYASRVQAGFPSPADDAVETALDLNRYLIKHPAATFFVRVSGDSMIQASIHAGDILIVDRSLSPKTGNIVIAIVDGELTVKRLKIQTNQYILVPENSNYQPLVITPDMDFSIWGVVTTVIHSV